MTTLPLLNDVVSPALVRGVGFALLHSLWQGGVLALLLAGVLPLLRHRRAELRYALSAGALATLVLVVGLTFGWYYHSAPPAGAAPIASAYVASQLASAQTKGVGAAPVAALPASATPARPLAWLQVAGDKVERYLPLVVVAWLLGLLLMSGRLAGGLLYAGRLRRAGTQALGAEWQQRLAALAARAGLRRPVALLESARVAGPLVLGHWHPAILLPLGAVAGLSPSLLEALLAHELAHIVRRDYLLNLGLAVAEVLFFYHPAVWFMAGCLRAERENCCDDQAAALCGGDRLRVARALAALAELETVATPMPRLALAAAGGGRGSLLARVRRLALSRPQAPTLNERLLAGSLTLLGLLGLSTGVVLAAQPAQNTPAQTVPAVADTARRPALVPPAPPTPPVPAVVDSPLQPEKNARVEVRDNEQDAEPDARPRRLRQTAPRRGPASTVVIEKDKKGRVVRLSVDGQPIETATPGKKAKRAQAVRTVEVVRVPARLDRLERPERIEMPERPERPEQRTFSFDFSTTDLDGAARRAAEQSLRETLRDPDLNAEQRREIARELARGQQHWQQDQQVRKLLHFNFSSATAAHPPRPRFYIKNGKMKVYKSDSQESARADRAAEQADRDAAQADQEATRADRDGDAAELAARRAELRARLAADAAELRALERGEGRGPRRPTPPRTPQAPMMPQAPLPPPPPPAPKTAELRAALRQDGLLGKNDRSFSFSLNDKGGSVNGQALTPAQVARYRQLLGQPVSGQGKASSFTITVNEN